MNAERGSESEKSREDLRTWDELERVEFAGDRDKTEALETHGEIEALETHGEIEGNASKYEADDIIFGMVYAPFIAVGSGECLLDDNFVRTEGFFERQSQERQDQMKQDFSAIEMLRVDLRAAERQSREHLDLQEQLIRKKSQILKKHLDDPDCLEYFMEVSSEPIEVATMDMFLVDPGRTLNHFDHMSELLEDKFGTAADQAVYNMFQYAILGENLLQMENQEGLCFVAPDKTINYHGSFQLPKPKDY